VEEVNEYRILLEIDPHMEDTIESVAVMLCSNKIGTEGTIVEWFGNVPDAIEYVKANGMFAIEN
jgi:hypothetical protein